MVIKENIAAQIQHLTTDCCIPITVSDSSNRSVRGKASICPSPSTTPISSAKSPPCSKDGYSDFIFPSLFCSLRHSLKLSSPLARIVSEIFLALSSIPVLWKMGDYRKLKEI